MFKIDFLNTPDFNTTFNSNSLNFNAELNVLYPAKNGIPPGGIPGSLLTKISVKDYDAAWVLPVDQVAPDLNEPVMSSAVYGAIINAVDNIMQLCAPVYYDTEENWNIARTMIAERRVIYVYSNHRYIDDGHGNQYPVPSIKIGDGTSYLIDLPFVNQEVEIELATHINNQIIHITQQEREFWNNKVTCYMDDINTENLIFSKQ